MMPSDVVQEKFSSWIAALDERHLANLTPSEVARALRALSSCYVERRGKLSSGVALGSAGKRAAFALFYGPLHFLIAREVVKAIGMLAVAEIVDLGCGNGAAGAAWALEAGGASIAGFDRNPWAVAEAQWTYRTLGLTGRARQADIARLTVRGRRGLGVIAAYTLNALAPEARDALLRQLIEAGRGGAHALVLEPIARRTVPWWDEWAAAFESAGGRSNEWRFPAALPSRAAALARAAGLDPRELTARSLSL
jgi:SAM-dependent methyltransferase